MAWREPFPVEQGAILQAAIGETCQVDTEFEHLFTVLCKVEDIEHFVTYAADLCASNHVSTTEDLN